MAYCLYVFCLFVYLYRTLSLAISFELLELKLHIWWAYASDQTLSLDNYLLRWLTLRRTYFLFSFCNLGQTFLTFNPQVVGGTMYVSFKKWIWGQAVQLCITEAILDNCFAWLVFYSLPCFFLVYIVFFNTVNTLVESEVSWGGRFAYFWHWCPSFFFIASC